MNSYVELKISINPNIEDEVSVICFERLNCEGVVLAEEKYKDLEMVSTTEGTLKVFLTDESVKDFDLIKQILQEEREFLLTQGLSEDEIGSWDISFEEKENEDWSKKWKEHWDITHISDSVVIVPSWLEYAQKNNEIVVSLDPGHAFGTGTHQTTQLCVKAMEQYPISAKDVADIGMGSGILSIIAKKMGANYVYGCDIDTEVLDVAKENAKKNNVECIFEENTADKVNQQFDFICANILHNVLYEIMPDLKALMKQDAKMVLSGILDEKKGIVLKAIEENSLKILKINTQDQWISFVVEK
ncbi:MAG: 50S ribosomal protein L11 methyltransferase [Candidatus Gastranaerophilaceae bacterium]